METVRIVIDPFYCLTFCIMLYLLYCAIQDRREGKQK